MAHRFDFRPRVLLQISPPIKFHRNAGDHLETPPAVVGDEMPTHVWALVGRLVNYRAHAELEYYRIQGA